MLGITGMMNSGPPRRGVVRVAVVVLLATTLVSLLFVGTRTWAGKTAGKSRTVKAKPASRKPKPTPTPTTSVVSTPMVVLGFNDLGMHCINPEFSEMCILPPYNNLHAQVIDRSREEPRIVTSGIQVKYSIPGNTQSTTKTNFWQYAQLLFGLPKPLAPNIGLTGNGLSGTMKPNSADGDWSVTGIPITPITDQGIFNPFQLSLIQVTQNGKLTAQTQAVVPVSWEISCNICHNTPGVSTATDILTRHDAKHQTKLIAQKTASKPVLCTSCHADPALGTPGVTGVKAFSHAMHGSHASRMAPAAQFVSNACYACHPGKQTECLRDIHYMKGMTCTDCHGTMDAVGNVNRRPWVDEPKCGSCHNKPGFAFEEPGKLYKDSRGHNGVKCASCHGSPHAITPTVQPNDNVQAIAVQGYPGTINNCNVCHKQRPDDPFNHTLHGD